ncbi:hypothetical protein GCM10027436_29390 [Actinophytocola sediminis]
MPQVVATGLVLAGPVSRLVWAAEPLGRLVGAAGSLAGLVEPLALLALVWTRVVLAGLIPADLFFTGLVPTRPSQILAGPVLVNPAPTTMIRTNLVLAGLVLLRLIRTGPTDQVLVRSLRRRLAEPRLLPSLFRRPRRLLGLLGPSRRHRSGVPVIVVRSGPIGRSLVLPEGTRTSRSAPRRRRIRPCRVPPITLRTRGLRLRQVLGHLVTGSVVIGISRRRQRQILGHRITRPITTGARRRRLLRHLVTRPVIIGISRRRQRQILGHRITRPITTGIRRRRLLGDRITRSVVLGVRRLRQRVLIPGPVITGISRRRQRQVLSHRVPTGGLRDRQILGRRRTRPLVLGLRRLRQWQSLGHRGTRPALVSTRLRLGRGLLVIDRLRPGRLGRRHRQLLRRAGGRRTVVIDGRPAIP